MTDQGFDERQWGLAVALMPERLRLDMARAACVLIGDELLRGQVVDASRTWRSSRPDPHGPPRKPAPPATDDPEFRSSLEWLTEQARALTGDDVAQAWGVREQAVQVAGGLGDLVLGGGVQPGVISDAASLLQKLGVYWARLDMDVQAVVDHRGIADEDIRSGPSVFFDALAAAVGEV